MDPIEFSQFLPIECEEEEVFKFLRSSVFNDKISTKVYSILLNYCKINNAKIESFTEDIVNPDGKIHSKIYLSKLPKKLLNVVYNYVLLYNSENFIQYYNREY